MTVHSLNMAVLPDAGPERVPPGADMSRFTRPYDAKTLWYDAFWGEGRLTVICPRLFNLSALVSAGRFRADGAALARPRHHRKPRWEQLTWRVPKRPERLSLETDDGLVLESAVGATDFAAFEGLNTHLTMFRNDAVPWMQDFARFHMAHHGLEAMLLFNNGSTDYSSDDVRAALGDLGLKRVMVLDADRPYGPSGRHKYLQSGLWNIARLRFLQRARAVLLADFDELFVTTGPTVFDAARASWLGFASFEGHWRHPEPGSDPSALPRHRDHVLISPDSPPNNAKYAATPKGIASRSGWEVHKPDFLSVDKLIRHKSIRYAHCAGINITTLAHKQHRNRDVSEGQVTVDKDLETALRVLDT